MHHLNYLRYFHAVSRTRSIRKAAESLNVAQSAVSRQIKNLEAELGVPLFERHARGVRLTDAGEILARYTRQTMLNLERTRSEIEDLRALRRGTVNLCTVEAGIGDIVPGVIGRFRELYPGVKVAVWVRGTHGVVEALLNDDADIGLTFSTPEHPDITVVASREQRLNVVVAPTHPIGRRRSARMADLADYPVALPDASFGIRQLVDEIQRRAGLTLEPVLLTNSIQALVNFARLGQGVTFLPFFAVRSAARSGEVVAIPMSDRPARTANVDVIVHAGRRLPIAAEEFLEHLMAALKLLR